MPDSNVINVVIDLSHNNPNADFVAAKNDGIVGVIHKATEGMTFTDPAYAGRKQRAANAGLLWGAYHFGTKTSDGASQAKRFLDVVQPTPQTLIVLDFEHNDASPQNTMTIDQARQFITTINDQIGRFPGLYCGSFVKGLLTGGNDPVLASCWLWWAEYRANPTIPPNWANWTFWQYTDGTAGTAPFQVQGIGTCDRDKFNGDSNALLALWGQAAAAATADSSDDSDSSNEADTAATGA